MRHEQYTRLALIKPEVTYAQDLFSLITNNSEYLSKWLAWPKYVTEISDSINFIENALEESKEGNSETYFILYENKPIGIISFNKIDKQNKIGYMGYWISESMQGRGIVKHSVDFLLRIGFNNLMLNKVVIRCAVGNVRSESIALRFNFKYEGIARQNELINDVFIDHKVYSLLKSEFKDKYL